MQQPPKPLLEQRFDELAIITSPNIALVALKLDVLFFVFACLCILFLKYFEPAIIYFLLQRITSLSWFQVGWLELASSELKSHFFC